jgi:hypothetical protein
VNYKRERIIVLKTALAATHLTTPGHKRRDLATIFVAVCHRKTGNHLYCQLTARKHFGKSPAFVAGGS